MSTPLQLLVQTPTGVPLLRRCYGDCHALSFPTIGVANGVFVFAENHDFTADSSDDGRMQVVWSSFHNSLVMALVSPVDTALSRERARRLLSLVWHAIVLVLGQRTLTSSATGASTFQTQRLKRDLRACVPLLDRVLSLDTRALSEGLLGMATGAVDALDLPKSNTHERLSQSAAALGTDYAVLLLRGRIASATDRWWQLEPTEVLLLSALLHSFAAANTGASLHEIPIYLPLSSPDVAHRFVCVSPSANVEYAFVLGEDTTTAQVTEALPHLWEQTQTAIHSALSFLPHSPLSNFTLDHSIQLAIVIDQQSLQRRTFSLFNPSLSLPTRSSTTSVLLPFLHSVSSSFFLPPDPLTHLSSSDPSAPSLLSHFPRESFHTLSPPPLRLYALRSHSHIFFLLFNPSFSLHAMQSIARDLSKKISTPQK